MPVNVRASGQGGVCMCGCVCGCVGVWVCGGRGAASSQNNSSCSSQVPACAPPRCPAQPPGPGKQEAARCHGEPLIAEVCTNVEARALAHGASVPADEQMSICMVIQVICCTFGKPRDVHGEKFPHFPAPWTTVRLPGLDARCRSEMATSLPPASPDGCSAEAPWLCRIASDVCTCSAVDHTTS